MIFTETLSTKTFADNYEFKKQISEKLFVLLKDDLDHMYINFSLNLMDIKLSPMIYAGQDYDNETGNDYAKMIKEVNQKIKKEIKAKYSEDTEDTEDEEKICAI